MAGLLDFLQSASNSASGNLSAPVDGINWLLKKAGVPVSNAPYGGSDWMAQKGFTRPVEQSGASLAGETMGLLSPMLAAAKAPQIAKGLLQMGENLAAPQTLNPQTGAVVWHGSPHKFDKFDSGKIGTGEGAQMFGKGLYLADSQDVAGQYAKNIMGPAATPENIALKVMNAGNDPVQRLRQIFPKMTDVEVNGAIQSAKGYQGNTYKVDLPDEHIAKMVDWDKSLNSQNNAVYGAFRKAYQDKLLDVPSSGSAGSMMVQLQERMGAKEAAEYMLAQGIPGVRYLDGGSRATGGTSNYVVFPGNENILSIMERNGQALK